MKFLKETWSPILIALFLIVVGILILVDPATYGLIFVKIAGALLALMGIIDIIKYFRASAEEAAKGQSFSFGAILITIGIYCILSSKGVVEMFPTLAVLYGLFQVLLGYRKLQRTVDALRMKTPRWYLRGISACLCLLFGFLIVFNPGMAIMSIWVFTGITLIVEGLFEAFILFLQIRQIYREKHGDKEVAEQEAPAAYAAEGSQTAYTAQQSPAAYAAEGSQAGYTTEGSQTAYTAQGSQAAYAAEGSQAAYAAQEAPAAYAAEGPQTAYTAEGSQTVQGEQTGQGEQEELYDAKNS